MFEELYYGRKTQHTTGVFSDSRGDGININFSSFFWLLFRADGTSLNISSYIWLLEQYRALVISRRNILALPSRYLSVSCHFGGHCFILKINTDF